MTAEIKPFVPSGNVKIPPSKSELHRALILAALTGGKVENYYPSDDIKATFSALENLGAKAKANDDTLIFSPFDPKGRKEAVIDCKKSASTLRFLIPLCLLSGEKVTFTGEKGLFLRPLSEFEKIFSLNGISYKKGEDFITLCGKLKESEFTVSGDISSQFITGLLLALPFIKGGKITVDGEIKSKPYVDITRDFMEKAGVKTTFKNGVFKASGNYLPAVFKPTADLSTAAYIKALEFLGGKITLSGNFAATKQGDGEYEKIYEKINSGEKSFDLKNVPDLAPAVFAACALTGGEYTFLGVERLKYKESDRLLSLKTEFSKFGVSIKTDGDTARLFSKEPKKPETALSSYGDHRIVMALTLLCLKTGGRIENAESVSKSYPEFFTAINSLKEPF